MPNKSNHVMTHRYAIGDIVYFLSDSVICAMKIYQVNCNAYEDSGTSVEYTGSAIITAGRNSREDDIDMGEENLFTTPAELNKIMKKKMIAAQKRVEEASGK